MIKSTLQDVGVDYPVLNTPRALFCPFTECVTTVQYHSSLYLTGFLISLLLLLSRVGDCDVAVVVLVSGELGCCTSLAFCVED